MRFLRGFLVCLLVVPAMPLQVFAQVEGQPRILARREWGADESLLLSGNGTTQPDTVAEENLDTDTTPSQREKDCTEARVKYPEEFKASVPVTHNAQGQRLRWPQEYSSSVRLLVVHHTAIAVTGDARSGLERMRALYEYHAKNRGWGDIGYHYVVDETGQIYEGRAGGDYVLGGHVYCNNIGTVGVTLMGNFEKETPTQEQAKSLQWLLKLLAEKYDIDLHRNVIFHGKSLSPIVGHRELLSTECPGYTLWTAFDQIRANVRSGNVNAPVTFPVIQTSSSSSARSVPVSEPSIVTGPDGLASLSETVIEGRPGGEVILPIFFRATKKAYPRNTRIARVVRKAGIDVWQERDGKFEPVRGGIEIPVPLVKKGESVLLKVKVRLPMTLGESTLKIGSLTYKFRSSGRRVRGQQLLSTGRGAQQLPEYPKSTNNQHSSISSISSISSPSIRIKLTPELPMTGLVCEGSSVKTSESNSLTHVEGYFRLPRSFRGSVECRIIDGVLTLINELPLEEYLWGLTEEPDTEHYQKQRAFAIAARTYARFYMDPANRKFPGKPYDGSDHPAEFQAYGGYDVEQSNPRWIQAVKSLEGQVLKYRGNLIKTPYFSTDTGTTRSPEEAGWKDFPFPEIFSAKPDPWCAGMALSGHGVGMSGCGAGAQAREGKSAEEILRYYYPGTDIVKK